MLQVLQQIPLKHLTCLTEGKAVTFLVDSTLSALKSVEVSLKGSGQSVSVPVIMAGG